MPYLLHPTERLYKANKEGALGTRAIEITSQNVPDIAAMFEEAVIYRVERGGSRVHDGFLCNFVVDKKMKVQTRRKAVVGDFVLCLIRAQAPVMPRETFLEIFDANPVDWWKP